MRLLPALLLLAMLPVASFGENQSAESSEPMPWLYTLVVGQNQNQFFSFSLLRNGSLAYEMWGDDQDLTEKVIALSAGQFIDLRQRFGVLFADQLTADASDAPPTEIAYTLEKTFGDDAQALQYAGEQPATLALLDALKDYSGQPFPFPIGHKITITVTPDSYYYNGELTTWDRVEASITEMPGSASVTVQADPKTPFKRVSQVLDYLSRSGIEVAVTTVDETTLPGPTGSMP
ncbi:MAG: ExbD/TolR family protein [Puniceicoccales bacterium]